MGNDSLDGCLNSFICRSNMEREGGREREIVDWVPDDKCI